MLEVEVSVCSRVFMCVEGICVCVCVQRCVRVFNGVCLFQGVCVCVPGCVFKDKNLMRTQSARACLILTFSTQTNCESMASPCSHYTILPLTHFVHVRHFPHRYMRVAGGTTKLLCNLASVSSASDSRLRLWCLRGTRIVQTQARRRSFSFTSSSDCSWLACVSR